MINLQIAGNNVQPSGSAANASPASTAVDALAAEPFAFLLAQQLDGASLLVPDAAQTALAVGDSVAGDEAEPVASDAQNQVAIIDDQPSDPAVMLAAIVLAEDRGQKTGGREMVADGRKQRVDDLQRATDKLPRAEKLAVPPGNGQHDVVAEPDSLPSDAFRRMDISATLSGKFQPGANADATITAPTMSAAPPNTPINNRMADTMQTVNAPLGSSGWSNEFSQKISWMGIQQHQVAELHLNPPNLGPLDVVLKISDNQATALFTSPHGAVRDAVENALPKLREMLADNGITLGNATVSDQPPRDRGTEGFMNRDSGATAQRGIPGNDSESSGMTSADAQTILVRRHNGMVDTFA